MQYKGTIPTISRPDVQIRIPHRAGHGKSRVKRRLRTI